MTDRKPRVLATRHFPADVETRLAANFDARLNPEDKLYDGPSLAKAAEGFDGIMCAAGDPLNADDHRQALPASVRIIATFSVGYEHVDVAAAAKRNIMVSNTPDVLTDATADIAMLCMLGAARRAHEGTTMLRTHNWVGWEPTPAHGRACHRQAARHPRHGPDRPGAGRPRPRLPHDHPLQQPHAPSGRSREGRGVPRQSGRHAAPLRLPVDQRADDRRRPANGSMPSASPGCPRARSW